MNCNLVKVLKAVIEGAKSVSEVKITVPDVRNPNAKVQTLVESGHVEIDVHGQISPTHKGRKAVS